MNFNKFKNLLKSKSNLKLNFGKKKLGNILFKNFK